jgi:hypothetical protein
MTHPTLFSSIENQLVDDDKTKFQRLISVPSPENTSKYMKKFFKGMGYLDHGCALLSCATVADKAVSNQKDYVFDPAVLKFSELKDFFAFSSKKLSAFFRNPQ